MLFDAVIAGEGCVAGPERLVEAVREADKVPVMDREIVDDGLGGRVSDAELDAEVDSEGEADAERLAVTDRDTVAVGLGVLVSDAEVDAEMDVERLALIVLVDVVLPDVVREAVLEVEGLGEAVADFVHDRLRLLEELGV